MEEVLRLCPQITHHRRLREEREHSSYTCKERFTGQMTYTNRHINNVLPKVIHKARGYTVPALCTMEMQIKYVQKEMSEKSELSDSRQNNSIMCFPTFEKVFQIRY